MIPIDVNLDLERRPWTDLDAELGDTEPGTLERVGVLPNATGKGLSVAYVVIRLPDGTRVAGRTTLALFDVAATAVQASPHNVRERPLR